MRTTSYATLTVAVIINWLCGSVKSDLLSQWCTQNSDICDTLLEEIRGKYNCCERSIAYGTQI